MSGTRPSRNSSSAAVSASRRKAGRKSLAWFCGTRAASYNPRFGGGKGDRTLHGGGGGSGAEGGRHPEGTLRQEDPDLAQRGDRPRHRGRPHLRGIDPRDAALAVPRPRHHYRGAGHRPGGLAPRLVRRSPRRHDQLCARLKVSAATELLRSMLVTGFPYDLRDDLASKLRLFNRFMGEARAIRRDGAAALDLCYLAAGRVDGFWEERLQPWDMMAGILMVTEAGGTASRFDGSRLGLRADEIVASNGVLHP